MVMIIIAYLWFFFLVLFTMFIVIGSIIERNFDECHKVKKWWRKHVVGWDPQYPRPDDDCID
jgi:hypothetical protein